MRYGLIIPTLNAGAQFQTLLEQISAQNLPMKKLIADSESTDDTCQIAKSFGFEVLNIPRKNFNHGSTRQSAIEKILPLDVVIFLTQDVLLLDDSTLSNLIKIFDTDKKIGLAYGRQLPHSNATLEAKVLREFNYPAESQIRNFASAKNLGLKAAMASNSFAAYRAEVLQKVGGFPNVILCEDMYVAAKMLLAGYKVAYNAVAQVYHSHNYTAAEEFHRYFDIGIFHSRESWIREKFGSAEGAGKNFLRLKYSKLIKNEPLGIFGSLLCDAMKFLGYRLGRLEKFLPRFIIRQCSLNKNFWGRI